MMLASEAEEAWWPPTFSPSVLGRTWLAWWMVHDDSHSTLRASADSISRRAGSMGITVLPGQSFWPMLAGPAALKISNYRDIPGNIGINYQWLPHNHEFIPMHALDAIDRKMLSLLQSDSRMTMQELADQ